LLPDPGLLRERRLRGMSFRELKWTKARAPRCSRE